MDFFPTGRSEMGLMMKKIMIAYVLMLCVLLTSCTMPASKENVIHTNTQQAHFSYEFADVSTGIQLLLSNKEYHDNFTKADLEYRLQKKGGTKEEYIKFAESKVLEFTEEEKAAIMECMQQIESIAVKRGYRLPKINSINFVKTTMEEECNAAAYTHNSDIYIGEAFLKEYLLAPENEKIYYTATILHELFHCITRNTPDFRKDLYEMIGFTIVEKDFEIPPHIRERMISNPDVGNHNSYASFTINGEKKDCFVVFLTIKDFENQGDTFFENASAHLIPVDHPDTVYHMDEAEDFWTVFGRNTAYVIDPEECLADNFSYAFLKDEEGFIGIDWPNPEILEKIVALLQADDTGRPAERK